MYDDFEQHPDLTPTIITDLQSRLKQRWQELEEASLRSQRSRAAVDLDQSRVGRLSRMDALQMQAMEQANESRRIDEILRIQKALAKIKSDDLGYCDQCAEWIAIKRIQYDPALLLCVDCA
jgi:DnaK suppressor protein